MDRILSIWSMFNLITTTFIILHVLSPIVIAQSTASDQLTISVPPSVPPTSRPLDPALISFSIEQDRWPEWIATNSPSFDQPNTFFLNALDNLKQRTGAVPWIRIGANSEDRTNFNNRVRISQTLFPPPTTTVPFPEATNITVGDGYYRLARFLPFGTHVIWGLNLGQNNITAAFLNAASLHAAFASDQVKNAGITLDFVEIGNEPDLFGNNGARNSSAWNIGEYVKEWTTFAQNVSLVLRIGTPGGPEFIGASFAGSSHSTNSFSPQGAFAKGLLNSDVGKMITTISQHHYSGSFCSGSEGLLQDLMTKSTIRSNLTAFIPDIAVTQAEGLDYVFDETNSYACHGAPGVSNTAGAALWTLDYTLFAASLGITRVHFHEGIGFKYNLIQPATLTRSPIDGSPLSTPLPPHVQPQYYSAIIIAEFIGMSPGSQNRIAELQINDSRLSGFAAFDGVTGSLTRIVLINSEAFLASQDASGMKRPSKLVKISTSGREIGTVKRLEIIHADDISGLTWAGQSFETADVCPEGEIVEEVVKLDDGIVVSASEVVLVSFN